MEERYESFEDVERRLQAIVEEVSGDIPLDDALRLYEEAAQIGRLACTMSERDIEEAYPSEEPEGQAAAEPPAEEGAPEGQEDPGAEEPAPTAAL